MTDSKVERKLHSMFKNLRKNSYTRCLTYLEGVLQDWNYPCCLEGIQYMERSYGIIYDERDEG